MIIKHNKGKYIRKYDYLRSFYLPKDEWFISTNVLAQTINDLLKAKNKIVDEQDDEEEQEIDAYSYYKESRDDGNLCNLKQEDVDPKIIEGNIIDEQAKQFIKAQFKLESFDFSNINLKESHEQAFEQTKKYLSKNNIILFQPTFINGDLITKPDALVIQDGKATLIEVKGTTNPKISHTFDLYFQFNVIDPIIKLNKCMLCLIKYKLLNKKQVSFILNERGSFSKTGFSEPSQIKKLKKEVGPFDEEVIEFKSQVRNALLKEWDYSNPEFNFIDLFTNQIDDKWLEKLPKRVGSRDFLKEELNADAFSSRINELREFQPDDNILPKFEPCLQYKSTLRNADNWLSIRELWLGTTKYFGTQFSGDLLSYSDALLLNKKQWSSIDEFILNLKNNEEVSKRMKVYLSYLLSDNSDINKILVNGQVIGSYKSGVKDFINKNLNGRKKVYFDFESINTAIRVVDKTPPFVQAVNQVSVCYDIGDGLLKQVESLVLDPKDGLSSDDYKLIIDRILPPTEVLSLDEKYNYWNQFKYVVYNKSFECTRLKEMKYLINDGEYSKKVEIIVNNIVDLADLFTISSCKNQFMVFKELKGFYSIKKVLPIVMKYDKTAFEKAGCKDYHGLDVQNGTMAQSLSTRRFFNLIKTDEEWNSYVNQLKIYCDNDVRAMVAVEYFVRDILSGENVKFDKL